MGASSRETMRADRPYEPHEANHGRQYFYAIATVAVFGFVVAAYVHSHRSAQEMASEAQVAQGTIAGLQNASATLAENAPTSAPTNPHANASANDVAPPGSVPSPVAVPVAVPVPAPETAPETAPAPPPARSAMAAPITPPHREVAPRTETARRGAASLKALRDERAVAMKREAGLRADVARNIAMARANLDKNNLGPARRSIMAALAEQPGNGEALGMQAELASREQQRDSLLGYARLCARQADWVCAWHNAGHALTIDASNSEARGLLSRAMAEQSAKGEREFDPSLDTQ
ncbi:MAG TPA: hypothetical protein VJS30_05325 [Paraburkholderia sp.]|nr:hypothetical protein [Paraburkholderia sp.]